MGSYFTPLELQLRIKISVKQKIIPPCLLDRNICFFQFTWQTTVQEELQLDGDRRSMVEEKCEKKNEEEHEEGQEEEEEEEKL